MSTIDTIISKRKELPKLCHAKNIVDKYKNKKTTAKQKQALEAIMVKYLEYLDAVLTITNYEDSDISKKVDRLNDYYNYFRDNDYDQLFSSQSKFRSTILEEFVFLLFKDLIADLSNRFECGKKLRSGNVKAYTNLFFKPCNLESFVNEPEIGINIKNQDYAIFRVFDVSVDRKIDKKVNVPVLAIEAKTYIDKTMLDGIIATAEKLKNGNPYTRFVAVAERYEVSLDVDPSYSRIDQIYILRKGMKKGEWADIDTSVILRLFHETQKHLNRPWSDVRKRLEEDGVIL